RVAVRQRVPVARLDVLEGVEAVQLEIHLRVLARSAPPACAPRVSSLAAPSLARLRGRGGVLRDMPALGTAVKPSLSRLRARRPWLARSPRRAYHAAPSCDRAVFRARLCSRSPIRIIRPLRSEFAVELDESQSEHGGGRGLCASD